MLLALQGVHTYIDEFHILQGIDMEIAKGEIVVLLGRNGAGKTTTIRSILGITPPTKGTIELGGKPIHGLASHLVSRKGIGYVPEENIVFNDLTVRENLLIALRDKKNRSKERLDHVLTLFPDLKEAFHKKGGNLSGGQKQMLAIGRAMLNENQLILVDEPSKGLAPVVIDKIVEALNNLKHKTSILLVEQNFDFANRVADRYYLIDNGVTVQHGTMQELAEDKIAQQRYLGIGMKENA